MSKLRAVRQERVRQKTKERAACQTLSRISEYPKITEIMMYLYNCKTSSLLMKRTTRKKKEKKKVKKRTTR